MKIVFIYLISVLFSNLDDLSNKGLIKGLLMLSHSLDKKTRLYEQTIIKMKKTHAAELKEKDNSIKTLDEDLQKFKTSLKGRKNILI